jgi:hypothetical protein
MIAAQAVVVILVVLALLAAFPERNSRSCGMDWIDGDNGCEMVR